MRPHVVLVGPPGAGKTTVGKLVAKRLGVELRDTDDDVEAAAGKAISDIFIDDGEATFRALEYDAVASALVSHGGVLALGGGAVVNEQTRKLLADHQVVFLDVGLSDAVSRVGLNRDRPLLLDSPRAALNRLMEERRPLYVDVASVVVNTAGRSAEDVAAEVVAHVR